jgi:hypothetical protein
MQVWPEEGFARTRTLDLGQFRLATHIDARISGNILLLAGVFFAFAFFLLNDTRTGSVRIAAIHTGSFGYSHRVSIMIG